jgi:hypothetical protein
MMRRPAFLWIFLSAAALVASRGVCTALEEVSLLTSDGTLHVVRSGTALELGIVEGGIAPQENLIDWTSRAQSGTVTTAVLPDTISFDDKHGLSLAFDEQTATLLLLWTEDISAFSQIRVGVLHGGTWTNTMLFPSTGISRANNPKMLVTHRKATYLDEHDKEITKTSSILSVVWWEEAESAQARYATLFLDETAFDPTALTIYDLPALVGTTGTGSYGDLPSGAYLYPSLQADGLSGSVLVSFTDLQDQKFKVVRVDFPTDRGKPSDPTSVNWKRRHIPIVGVTMVGPMARSAPSAHETRDGIRTTIGVGYRPTLSWGDASSLKYTRLDGADWAPVHSIAIDDKMTWDRALALVTGMGERN